MAREGLLVDFGGVLTSNVFASFAAFCEAEGLDPEHVRRLFGEDRHAQRLLFELELGNLEPRDFEREFAAVLGTDDERLIERLFAGMQPDDAMVEGVARARSAGKRTGLISNSWGAGTAYDVERFPELFDAWVISSEVGLRKPDPGIYRLGAERIGVAPEDCVFVDDLPGNLKPARALGMATVHHVDAQRTLEELEGLLGVTLR